MDKSNKDKVIQLFKEASSPWGASSVSGDGNVIGNTITGHSNVIGSNNVVIHSPKLVTKTIADVKPGEEHITDEQAAELQRLVGEIVALEQQLKRHPKGFQAVWGALNKKCRAPKYRLIKLEHYPNAEKYLRQWIGRLSSSKSAPHKAQNWRPKKYAYIKANCRNLGLEDKLKSYLRTNFGVTSLTDLNDEALVKAYSAVAGWKKAGQP